jgi:hypothetical protein
MRINLKINFALAGRKPDDGFSTGFVVLLSYQPDWNSSPRNESEGLNC